MNDIMCEKHFDIAPPECQMCSAEQQLNAADALAKAGTHIKNLLDDGLLVRNTTHDGSDDYAMQMMALVCNLKDFVEALAAYEKVRGQEFYDEGIKDAYREGNADAYEDAAEIADDEYCVCNGNYRIAGKIRARAKEVR